MNIIEAEDMIIKKMELHDLTYDDWDFKWDRAVKRFGCTHFKTKVISLSKPLVALNSKEVVTKVILHEIAHVLAGPHAPHDAKWKAICLSIGGDGKRCYNPREIVMVPHDNSVIKTRKVWVGQCRYCGHKTNKRLRRLASACRICCTKFNKGQFNKRFLLVWHEVLPKPMTMTMPNATMTLGEKSFPVTNVQLTFADKEK